MANRLHIQLLIGILKNKWPAMTWHSEFIDEDAGLFQVSTDESDFVGMAPISFQWPCTLETIFSGCKSLLPPEKKFSTQDWFALLSVQSLPRPEEGRLVVYPASSPKTVRQDCSQHAVIADRKERVEALRETANDREKAKASLNANKAVFETSEPSFGLRRCLNKGARDDSPSNVVPGRYRFFDVQREKIIGIDSGDYESCCLCLSDSNLGARPRLHDDGPDLYERVEAALKRAERDCYSPYGTFLGDDIDMTFCDTHNGLEFFGIDRSGHSGRTRHA